MEQNKKEREMGQEIRELKGLAPSGIHCESCGQSDPVTDDGYTACCNEPTCWGDGGWGSTPWAVELRGEVIATVRACCGAALSATLQAEVIEWDSFHADCNDPACQAHKGLHR